VPVTSSAGSRPQVTAVTAPVTAFTAPVNHGDRERPAGPESTAASAAGALSPGRAGGTKAEHHLVDSALPDVARFAMLRPIYMLSDVNLTPNLPSGDIFWFSGPAGRCFRVPFRGPSHRRARHYRRHLDVVLLAMLCVNLQSPNRCWETGRATATTSTYRMQDSCSGIKKTNRMPFVLPGRRSLRALMEVWTGRTSEWEPGYVTGTALETETSFSASVGGPLSTLRAEGAKSTPAASLDPRNELSSPLLVFVECLVLLGILQQWGQVSFPPTPSRRRTL
jgi:hypothetical protein